MFYPPKDIGIATLARHLPSSTVSDSSSMAPSIRRQGRVRRRRRRKVTKN